MGPDVDAVNHNEFQFNDATFFYSGPITSHFNILTEIEISGSGETDLLAHIGGTYGNKDAFWNWRLGQMHTITRVGFGGLDRPSGISSPLFMGARLTGTPYRIATDQRGLEVSYNWQEAKNRVFGQLLNGVDPVTGSGTSGDADNQKDFVLGYSRIIDDVASGFSAVLVSGRNSIDFVDGNGNPDDATYSSYRMIFTGNKVFAGGFDLLGGFIHSMDRADDDLGIEDVDGNALFIGAEKYFDGRDMTLLSRFDWYDQNTDIDDSNVWQFTGGVVWTAEQHIRVAFEYQARNIQHGEGFDSTTDQAGTFEVMANF